MEEVPVGLAARLARQAALWTWTNVSAHRVWRPPALAAGSRGYDEMVAWSSNASGAGRASVRELMQRARGQAVDALGGRTVLGDLSPRVAGRRADAMYRPVPATPLVTEEERLDAMLRSVTGAKPPAPGHGLRSCWGDGGRAATVCYLTLTMEYGRTAGTDPFDLRRAVTSEKHAARSKFLHPVIRLWRAGGEGGPREQVAELLRGVRLPPCNVTHLYPPESASDEAHDAVDDAIAACQRTEGPWADLPAALSARPEFVSHMLEDFLSEFDRPYYFEAAANAIRHAVWGRSSPPGRE